MNEFTIEAGATERSYWRDIWRFRDLFLFLAWRDLLVRYKQTVVGVSWSLIRPLLTMAVLTMVFGFFGKMPSGGAPYALVVFCGMLPWQFFSSAISESGNSLVSNASLISKVYFPRIVIPASSVIVSVVDFLLSVLILIGLMLWLRFVPPINIVFLPLFVLLVVVASFGLGLFAAALAVKYRDVRFLIQFLLQFGLYISPVGFISGIVPENYQMLYALNPMVGIIDGFRWCVLGGQNELGFQALAVAIVWAAILMYCGAWYFRETEKSFADVI